MITKANIRRLMSEGKLQQFERGQWRDISFKGEDAPLLWWYTIHGLYGCISNSRTERHQFDDCGVFHSENIRIKPGAI